MNLGTRQYHYGQPVNTGSSNATNTIYNNSNVKAELDQLNQSLAEHTTEINQLNQSLDKLSNVSNVVEITSGNDISKLKEGINAVRFTTGVRLGSYTTSNNCRGYLMKQSNVVTGMISSYNASEIYIVATDSIPNFNYAKKL